jgi:hypothetical protein
VDPIAAGSNPVTHPSSFLPEEQELIAPISVFHLLYPRTLPHCRLLTLPFIFLKIAPMAKNDCSY